MPIDQININIFYVEVAHRNIQENIKSVWRFESDSIAI